MQQLLDDLVKVMTLERLELDLFRGESRDIGSPQVFGGQVLGQALMAATATVENRVVHSLHAYFLRRGDFDLPIVYEVDRARDGGNFTMRRIVAIQKGQQIFNMSASFQSIEEGLGHQIDMTQVPPPENLPTMAEHYAPQAAHLPPMLTRLLERNRPFEFRPVDPPSFAKPQNLLPSKHVWFRAITALPEGEALHRCLLAYVSDFGLLDTALMPHLQQYMTSNIMMASLDHAMWFHAPVRVDQWLLYSTDSPSASGARGFARGSIFSREGRLVASTAQEGLMRVIN